MARTTGYMATSVVRLIRDDIFTRVGVSPPEHLGMEERCFNELMRLLKDHGVEVTRNTA